MFFYAHFWVCVICCCQRAARNKRKITLTVLLARSVKNKSEDLTCLFFLHFALAVFAICFFSTCGGFRADGYLILWLNAISRYTAQQDEEKASGWGLVQLRGWRGGTSSTFLLPFRHKNVYCSYK